MKIPNIIVSTSSSLANQVQSPSGLPRYLSLVVRKHPQAESGLTPRVGFRPTDRNLLLPPTYSQVQGQS